MKKDKTWFQLIALKIALAILHTVTLGIPKLIKKINDKIQTIVEN